MKIFILAISITFASVACCPINMMEDKEPAADSANHASPAETTTTEN